MIVNFKQKIRDIPDFPEKGIVFRDISPLLEDKAAFVAVVRRLAKTVKELKIDKVVGIDARGFIFASVLAEKLKAGMVMVRKKGKLPFETEEIEYDLEYGKATLQLHRDSIKPGEKVLLVDDVLATGGTMSAAAKLVEKLGGVVEGIVFLIILDYLPGRERLKSYDLYSLVDYPK
jgi:adenine phosphoribosyltransferase